MKKLSYSLLLLTVGYYWYRAQRLAPWGRRGEGPTSPGVAGPAGQKGSVIYSGTAVRGRKSLAFSKQPAIDLNHYEAVRKYYRIKD